MSNMTSNYRIDGMEVYEETSPREGWKERLTAYAAKLSPDIENGIAAEIAAHAGSLEKEGGNA